VLVVDTIPKNPNGKVDRSLLATLWEHRIGR
jgi:acyl-CoA synthetase (AMP-forming)/AMP-acid ligase II